MKKCTKCGVEKPLSEFKKRSDTGKPVSSCMLCVKEYSRHHYQKNLQKRKDQKLKKAYGISLFEKQTMFSSQNNKCEICNTVFKNIDEAHVDHCHKTLKVRGLLCVKCNPGLGMFMDNLKTIESALKYLKKYSAKTTEK